ncbi:TPA_exp: Uncharacterized protein A8136_1995 [Trichophyton benhamiae CBS 112371]|uniref:Uncharacterized protein n=1 Tax=Arthroderma benhamiae (strain ATCC MYA-4681 / CBS 112371) TaxID=663331 RepID=D4AXW2_ARTBC|nr:uncharacterized protein ARB_01031 [Trichophyton benhamiae CBS 112371]EFE32140.1 hypothetical protein ARB_01031 [Trichophyton benhamiae CBS 112371]DAA75244.1 TPA_exp: Uncharacterized protein A8136_1995 [Trichophyton benhamiae CBS 112371]
MSNEIHLRLPSRLSSPAAATAETTASAASFRASSPGISSTIPLIGTWYVLSSSVEFLRDKKNVSIKYSLKELGQAKEAGGNVVEFANDTVLDSVTSYQLLSGEGSDIVDTTVGTERPTPNSLPGVFTWRGTGFAKFITNRWEVLGYGNLPLESSKPIQEGDEQPMWMVIYADKSMFSPSGLSIHSKGTKSLPAQTMDQIRAALGNLQPKELKDSVRGMVDILQE